MILSALLTSVGINLGLCFLFFTLYSILRKQPGNIHVYVPRLVAEGKIKEGGQFNLERLLPTAGWVRRAWEPSEEEFLSNSGLDAFVFMRIFIFSLKVFAAGGIIGMFILLPINYLGSQLSDDSDFQHKSLDSFSISNVNNGSNRLWVHFSAAYVFTGIVCYLLYNEYWYISSKRIACFYSSEPQPQQFTLLVRGIPVPPGSTCHETVEQFFQEYHPSTYLSHSVVRRSNKLHNLVDPKVIGTGTFGCGSTIVEGEDFIAENITFENSSPQGSGQAVAIRVTADRCAFYNCRFLGWQDTLYLHYGRQYLKDCYIEGSVDFIFGNSTALMEHCQIHCKSSGFITAQSRTSPQETTGYVFLRCAITGNGGSSYTYLGRPWKPFARVVFAFTYMDQCVKPAGWNDWGRIENEKTACFYEYRCFGAGYCPSERVKWAIEPKDDEAKEFVTHSFIDPQSETSWLPQRMPFSIPFSA